MSEVRVQCETRVAWLFISILHGRVSPEAHLALQNGTGRRARTDGFDPLAVENHLGGDGMSVEGPGRGAQPVSPGVRKGDDVAADDEQWLTASAWVYEVSYVRPNERDVRKPIMNTSADHAIATVARARMPRT